MCAVCVHVLFSMFVCVECFGGRTAVLCLTETFRPLKYSVISQCRTYICRCVSFANVDEDVCVCCYECMLICACKCVSV